MGLIGRKRWHQCPGCWSTVLAAAPEDGWLECDCGEAMTEIDLRAANYQGAVEALRDIQDVAFEGNGAAADTQRLAAVLKLVNEALYRLGGR